MHRLTALLALLVLASTVHAQDAWKPARFELADGRRLELLPLTQHMWTQGYGVRIVDPQGAEEAIVIDEYDESSRTVGQRVAAGGEAYFSDPSFEDGVLLSGGRVGPDAMVSSRHRLESWPASDGRLRHHFVLIELERSTITPEQGDGGIEVVYRRDAASAAKPAFDIRRWQTWGNATPNAFACAAQAAGAPAAEGYHCAGVADETARAGVVPDPCALADYYAGPWQDMGLPRSIAQRVHPDAVAGQLSWNAGFLQGVTVRLDRRFDGADAALAAVLRPLPQPGRQPQLGWSRCAQDADCVEISYFDFQDVTQFACPPR